ncbi:MAG: DUF962 domain-containing protein [Parasphingorhabdus sp.]
MTNRPKEHDSFESFWPFYLQEHSKSATRNFHYVGTSLVVAIGIYAIVAANWWLMLAMPLAGYFFAWLSHWRIEKNRPATFTYPLWSLIADFKMWGMWLTGQLKSELERAGVEEPE